MQRTAVASLTLGLLALCVTATAMAEVAKTDGQWRGAAGAAAAFTSGNTESTTANLSLDLARATDADRIVLGGSLNYGRATVDGVRETTTDKWAANGQYDHNLSPRSYVFGKLALEGDKIARLSLRSTLAGGLGYKLVDTPENTFSVFGGAGYTRDRYSQAQTIDGETDTRFARASVLLGEESAHQLTATTTLKQRLELYPGVSGDNALIAKFSAGLAVAINSTLGLTVGVTDTYNSRPPQGQEKNDLGVFTGINWKIGAL